MVRYMVKPVDREALLDVLAETGEQVKRVLLVDDDPESLQLFSRMLSSAEPSYEVLQATSGQRALGLLRERRPDAMLLDLVMPGMDGFQVLDAKIEDPSIRDIPVVVISSVLGSKYSGHFPTDQQLHIHMFLDKPVPLRKLVEVAKSLGQKPAAP